ncbi:hypothetical protein [Gandjariella thermophila]|nr:hypothetical protein [Gandjariella thermophila]
MPGPDTRVVELRVHGVHGTAPEDLVDAVAAVDVAGDGVGRIVRPADRLRRPAPGPVLHAAVQPVTRTVEGYHWGAMTSGGLAKSTWALLFPFALANVAHWMLPPVPEGDRPARVLGYLLRALLRLAALLLTMLLTAQLTVVSFDLLAAQCLAPGSSCLAGTVGEWLRELPGVRPAAGLLPVALAAYVLHRVSTVNWKVSEDATATTAPREGVDPKLPGATVDADPDTAALRTLHLTAALAVTALLVLGGPLRPTGSDTATVTWLASLVLLAVCGVGVLLLDDPTSATPSRTPGWVHARLGPVPRRVLGGLGAVVFAVSGVLATPLPERLAGPDATVETIAGLLVVVCVAFAVLLAPAALLARRGCHWSALPRRLRPWAGGWMAAPVLVLGALLGGGFGAGLAITVREAIHSVRLDLPAGYRLITLLWGAGAVLGLAAALTGVGVAAMLRWLSARRGRDTAPEVGLLHEGRPEDARRAARAWARASLERGHGQHVLLAVAGALATGAALAILVRLGLLPLPDWLQPLSTVGVAVLWLLVGGLLRLVYLAAARPGAARGLGILYDLASFWPREAHPVVPPCYALKAVPEVAARAAEHLKDPNTRVVLTGHSQGSLLVAVAASRLLAALPDADHERVGLVTAGSQLQWAYPRAFPAVVPHASLTALFGELGGRWRALCRGTDPLGGAVSSWGRQVYGGMLLGVGFRADGTDGALPAATRGPTGVLVLGGDHWLPDPQRGPFPGRRWRAGVLGHADYYSDPEWDRAVAMAAGLEPTVTEEPAEEPPNLLAAVNGSREPSGLAPQDGP